MNNNNINMGNVTAASIRPQNIQGSPENPHPKFTYKETFVKRSTPEEEIEAVKWGWRKTGKKSRGQNIWMEPILNPEWIEWEMKKKKHEIYLSRKAASEVKKTIDDLVKKVTELTEAEAERLAREELESIKKVMSNSAVGYLTKNEEEARFSYLKTMKMIHLQPQLEEYIQTARRSTAAAEEEKRIAEQTAKEEKELKRLAAAANRAAKRKAKTAKASNNGANNYNYNMNLGGGKRKSRRAVRKTRRGGRR